MTFATAAPFCRTRLLSSRDPAIPTRTDNEQNRRAVIFARALCRPHMNASTSSFLLIYSTHRERIATTFLSFNSEEPCRRFALSSSRCGLEKYGLCARLQNGEPEGNVVTHRIRRFECYGDVTPFIEVGAEDLRCLKRLSGVLARRPRYMVR